MANEFIDSKKLAQRIQQVQEELTKLLHLETFLGSSPAKRGRKPGSKATKVKGKTSKKKGKRAARGSVGKAILGFLESAGATGAHVTDIAKAIGGEARNVTAYFYTTGKKVKGIKRHGKNVFSYTPAKS